MSQLVLLPGTGGTVEKDFGPLIEELSPDLVVIGHDYHPDPDASYDSMVAEVVDRLQQFAPRTFVLCGYSMSAAVAVGVAHRLSTQIVGLVLISGFLAGNDERLVSEFRRWQHLIEVSPESFSRHIIKLGHHPDESASMVEREIDERVSDHLEHTDMAQTMTHIAVDLEIDLLHVPGSLQMPVLVIAGDADRIVDSEITRELADAIPGSQFEMVRAGHFVPLEQPTWLAQTISRWFVQHQICARQQLPGGHELEHEDLTKRELEHTEEAPDGTHRN